MVDLVLILVILGMASCAILYLSPIPSIIKALKTKDLQEISYTFLLMTHITPLTWILYAIQSHNTNLLVPNTLNSSIALIYILIYHYIKNDLPYLILKYIPFVLACYFVGFYILSLSQLGLAAMICNIVSYGGSLDQLELVLREKNSRYFDGYILAASLLCGSVWLAFGIVTQNIFVIIPNGIGILIALIQTLLFFWAKGKIRHEVAIPFMKLYNITDSSNKALKV